MSVHRVTINFMHSKPDLRFTTSLGIEKVMERIQDKILTTQKYNVERQEYYFLEFEVKVEAVN